MPTNPPSIGGEPDSSLTRNEVARLTRFEALLEQTLSAVNRLVNIVEGDGRNGLMSRVSESERQLKDIETKVTALSAAVFGDTLRPGIADRVADVERLMQSFGRTITAIVLPLVISVLLGVIGFIWGLVTHSIEIISK